MLDGPLNDLVDQPHRSRGQRPGQLRQGADEAREPQIKSLPAVMPADVRMGRDPKARQDQSIWARHMSAAASTVRWHRRRTNATTSCPD